MLKARSTNNTFTSHEFIGEYMKQCVFDYIGKFMEHRTRTGNHAFQKVNADIAKSLAIHKEELFIRKFGKVKDTNVRHTETGNEEWAFTEKS